LIPTNHRHNGDVTAATITDGCLPAALDRLYAAVAGLIDPVKDMHDNVIVSAPSLYEQLVGSIPTAKGEGMGRRASRSVAPVWTDALALRIEIDDKTREWRPESASTPARLRAVAARPWRTQDTGGVEQIAGRVESWSVSVQSLLNPVSVKHVSAPCPACGATTAFKRDSAGERVRVPALQIITELGCTCQVCRHTWGPELYLHLARVLGFQTPDGVIE
jgi:hypothetical protein